MYFDYIQLGGFEKRNRGGILTVVEHLLCTSLICSKEIFNDTSFMGEELKSHEAHVTCPGLSNNQANIWVYITLIQSPSSFSSCSQLSNDSARLPNIVEIVSIRAHLLYLPLFLVVNSPYILQASNTVTNFEHSSTKDGAPQHPDQKPDAPPSKVIFRISLWVSSSVSFKATDFQFTELCTVHKLSQEFFFKAHWNTQICIYIILYLYVGISWRQYRFCSRALQ